jgi:hypothetical protein
LNRSSNFDEDQGAFAVIECGEIIIRRAKAKENDGGVSQGARDQEKISPGRRR